MPAKPKWFRDLPAIIDKLQETPREFVDRGQIEALFGVSRRRAQQILRPFIRDQVGRNWLASKDELIKHLEALTDGAAWRVENDRMRALEIKMARHDRHQLKEPRVLVEADISAINQTIEDLPQGVVLQRRKVIVEFTDTVDVLQKLLKLGIAIDNQRAQFEEIALDSAERQGKAFAAGGVMPGFSLIEQQS